MKQFLRSELEKLDESFKDGLCYIEYVKSNVILCCLKNSVEVAETPFQSLESIERSSSGFDDSIE